MCKPKGNQSQSLLEKKEVKFTQAELETIVQRNEAETEFLEFNDQRQLVTKEEARQRRERVMSVQPTDNLQAVPATVQAIEGAMPLQQRNSQHCSWKDRHVRQKGAVQLREIAHAQITGEDLRLQKRDEQNPINLNTEANAMAVRHGRVITMMSDKEKRDQIKADKEMEYYSRNLRANMRRDIKERQGKKSGYRLIKELEMASKLPAVEKARDDTWNMVEALQVCGGERSEYLKSLEQEGIDVGSLAYMVSEMYQELAFRRQYVLPMCQSRGVKRRDLVDSVERMEKNLNALIAKTERDAEVFIARARWHITDWNEHHPQKGADEKIRKFMPDYKATDIVDLEEEERKLDGVVEEKFEGIEEI